MASLATVLTIRGQLAESDFADFAGLYARRLDLSGRYSVLSEEAIEIVLTGAPELIDMFEIACWLGPSRAIVAGIDVRNDVALNAPLDGFQVNGPD